MAAASTGRKAAPPPLLSPSFAYGHTSDIEDGPNSSWDIFNEYAENREDISEEVRFYLNFHLHSHSHIAIDSGAFSS